jgi:amino acid transporter
MKDTLKSIGSFLLGICILVGVMFILMMFIKGGVWLSERVYPWLVILTTIALLVVILVLLPLAIFRRTRAFAGGGIYLASYVFGLTLWAWSLLISYTIWGVTGIVIGLLLGGIGVVPIAILATLFHGMWSMVGQLLLVTAMTFGARFLGIWVVAKSEDHDHTPIHALQPTAAAFTDLTDD